MKEKQLPLGRRTKIIVIGVAAVTCFAIAPTFSQIRHDLGEVDVLVCSAGINVHKPAVDVTTVEWDAILSVNTRGLFFCNQAAANILGSNMFDLVIISATDFAYRKGPLFSSISNIHIMTVASAIAMNVIVIAALKLRPKRDKHFSSRWYDAPLVAIYVAGMIAVYQGYTLPI